jgi:hypothetical protein
LGGSDPAKEPELGLASRAGVALAGKKLLQARNGHLDDTPAWRAVPVLALADDANDQKLGQKEGEQLATHGVLSGEPAGPTAAILPAERRDTQGPAYPG